MITILNLNNNHYTLEKVGNKSDLQNVTVNREEYNLFVEEQNLLGFFEVSARDNTNVSVAVRSLVDSVLATSPVFQL